MFKFIIILTVWALLASPATAEINDKEYAKCAAIEGALVRLECFDNLAKEKKLNEEQVVSVELVGKWTVTEDINPIDDSKTVRLLLFADSGKGERDEPIFAIARCKSNETEFYISWGNYLGGAEITTISRADKQKAVTTNWHVSSNNKAAFHYEPIRFLKGILDARTLLVQVTPYNDNPVTAVFDISGLNNAIKPLRETCGW